MKNEKILSVSIKNDQLIRHGYHIISKDNKPLWELMKEYINDHIKIGNKFTRKDMLNYIYPNIGSDDMCYIKNTPDNYRCLLTNVEILKATNEPGIYIKLQNIPDNLTTSKLKKIVADKSWRKWFIPINERIN